MKSRMNKSANRITVLAAIAIFSLMASGTIPAMATNLLGHKLKSQDWTMGYHDLTNAFRVAGDDTINGNINPHPELNVNSITTTGVGQINLFDDTYGTSWSGRWECVKWSAANVCQQGNTYFNLAHGPYTSTDAKSLVCEEVGHGVGLSHNDLAQTNSGSCMQRPVCWVCTRWNGHDNTTISNLY